MDVRVVPSKPSLDELQIQNMINEGGRVDTTTGRPRDDSSGEDEASRMESHVPAQGGWVRAKVEAISARLGRRFVSTLGRRTGRLSDSLGRVPRGMRKVANQTALVLELIDDFKDGTYREVPWHTIAIASAGVLYAVNPADLVPNVLPLVGVMDDLAVIAIATRWIHEDLVAYCRFKGYDVNEYFERAS
jgi:uncharacterized membrane protein YkvA (DUF1232 family)